MQWTWQDGGDVGGRAACLEHGVYWVFLFEDDGRVGTYLRWGELRLKLGSQRVMN